MRWNVLKRRIVCCALGLACAIGSDSRSTAQNPLRIGEAPPLSVVDEPAAPPAPNTPPPVPSTEPSPEAAAPAAVEDVELTPPTVQARRQQIEEATGLDEVVKTESLRLYDQALQELTLHANFIAKAAQFEAKIKSVATDVQTNSDALKSLPHDADVGFLDDKTVGELDQLVRRKEQERDEARKAVEDLEAENARRADRRQELLKLIEASRARLAEIEQKLAVPAPAEQPAELQTARRTFLLAQRQAARSEIVAAEREIASYEARVELLPLRRRLAERRFTLAEKAVEKVRRVFEHKRMLDVQLQLTEAQSQIGAAPNEIRKLAEDNVDLALKRVELDEQLRQADAAFESAQGRLELQKSQFERTRLKVEKVGLTGAMGLLLRKQKTAMDNNIDLSKLRRDASWRQERIREANHELLEIEDHRSELGRFEREVRLTLAQLHPRRREELEPEVERFLAVKRDFLDALIADYNAYVDQLVDLDSAERELIQLTEQYHIYIEERVLWIRSNDALWLAKPREAWNETLAVVDPDFWQATGRAVLNDVRRNPQYGVLAILVFAPLFLYQRPLRRRLSNFGHMAEQGSCRRLDLTLRAVALTAMVAFLWPGLMATIGWRLSVLWADFDEALPTGIAQGLMICASAYFPIEFFRQVCRRHGLALSHFDWPEAGVEDLRRDLRLALGLGLPPIALAAAFDVGHVLGRAAFIVGMIIAAYLLHRILRPTGGAMQHFLAYAQDTLVYRLRYLWYAAGVTAPLALAVLTAMGYHYTAHQLSMRLNDTALLLLGVLLVRSLLLRWLLLNRRRAAMEQAQRRRAAQLSAPAGDGSTILTTPPAEEPGPDLAASNTQANRLLSGAVTVLALTGLWWVWIGVLPALGMLREIELWRTAVETVESSVTADGEVISRTTSTFRWVTLADAALACLVMMLAIVGGRNAPGFLDLALLHRLPLEPGVRYAIGTLTRYVLTVVGVIAACGLLGVGWTKVQWLVAAISVGLGFGLQEIFANFVSGLVILMERPVRVGDLVTIGETSGRVTRIQIRATTITDFDRKELVVPNKEFITGRVLNWTLSDQVNRVVVNVGIAHGSDISKARAIILGVAEEHPEILEDPAPAVTFNAFGDSSLNLVLFAWLPNLDRRFEVIHDLHKTIYERLTGAGIVIAFPQRNLNLHAAHPLEVRVVHSEPEEPSHLSFRTEKKAV